jgi:Tfp pilus assembly protein PilZ
MDKTPGSRRLEFPSEEVLRRIRIPFIRRAELRCGSHVEDVFLIDLSLLGAFVERGAPLELGQTVEIRFCFPDNETPLVVSCRVAWWEPAKVRAVAPVAVRALPAGAGLEFIEMSAADRERVRAYIAAYYLRDPNSRRFIRHGAWNNEG